MDTALLGRELGALRGHRVVLLAVVDEAKPGLEAPKREKNELLAVAVDAALP